MTTNAGTPPAEIDVTIDLVRELVNEQFPTFANLAITPASIGWDNANFRLGDVYAVRLPRRAVAARLITREQRWLPTFDFDVPIPKPVGIGQPTRAYPWPWSIVPWFRGRTANRATIGARGMSTLARFLIQLHRDTPPDAPHNPVRGGLLADRAHSLTPRLERLGRRIGPAALDVWQDALTAPPTAKTTWIHGDFHARNVLVENGELAAVIDWGDLACGDPATDLAAFWLWVPASEARTQAMIRLDHDEATWRRARGWAFLLSVVLLDSGLVDHPEHAAMGAAGLDMLSTHPDFP